MGGVSSRCLLVILVSLVLLLTGCTNHTIAPALDTSGSGTALDAATVRLYHPRYPSAEHTAQLQSQLAAAVCPAGVDPALWEQLRSALRDSLADTPATAADHCASLLPWGAGNELPQPRLVDDGGDWRIEWDYVNVGDYDMNSEVNVSDLVPVGLHFNCLEGGPGWDNAVCADGDCNGEVNFADVTPIGLHFATTVAGYNIYGRADGARSWTSLGSVPFDSASGEPRPAFSYELGTLDYPEYLVAPYDIAGDDAPQDTVVNPDAAVLEDLGLTIGVVGTDSLSLSGDPAGLFVGQVLVSGAGEGLIRKVRDINVLEHGILVHTDPATLEDVFDYLRLDQTLALDYAGLESFTPAFDGATLNPVAGASAPQGKDASFNLVNLKLEFPERKLVTNLNLQLAIGFALDLVLELEIGSSWEDLGTLYHFKYLNEFTIDGEVTLKFAGKYSFSDEGWLIGTAHFAPIPVMAGPIPIVFTPLVEMYCGFQGAGELAVEIKPSAAIVLSAGVEYTPSGGWDGLFSLNPQYEVGVTKPNSSLSLSGTFNMFSPQPTLKVYGIAGPYADVTAPFLELKGQLQSTPPEFSISLDAGLKAGVGAEVSALGHELFNYDNPELFSVKANIFTASWPLTGEDEAVLAGLVLDEYTDEGIPGVAVEIRQESAVVAVAVTDASGAYSEVVPEGALALTATKEHYATGTAGATAVLGETVHKDIVLTPNPGSLSGTVYDYDSGDPLAGVSVAVSGERFNDSRTTGADGGYSFADVPRGEYSVSFTKASYEPGSDNVSVLSDETTTCDCDLEPEGTSYPIEIITTWNGPDFTYTQLRTPDIGGTQYIVKSTALGSLFNPPYARFADLSTYNGLDVLDGLTRITIAELRPGYYNVKVLASYNWSLTDRGTQVEVRRNGGVVAVFDPPVEACPYHSGYWAVCYIDGTSGNVTGIGEYCRFETDDWPQ